MQILYTNKTGIQALQRLLVVASLLVSSLLLTTNYAMAESTETPATQATAQPSVTVTNPAAISNVHLGDVLRRTVIVDVPTSYQLAENALPKKGKKQEGIELVDVSMQSNKQSDFIRYTLQLSYQVFAVSTYPTVMHLPAEKLALSPAANQSGKDAGATATDTSLDIPAWGFWFSPLVTGGTVTAKKNILPDVKTPWIDSSANKQLFAVSLGMVIASLLGLLYINADGQWLPFMGGAFAKAHRQLKRLAKSSKPKTAAEEKKALVYLHQAFNQHFGANIFARDVEAFVSLRPGFKGMQQEITRFFEASNQSLYDTSPRDSRQVIAQLVQLSKQLRDCERGVA